MSDKPVVIVLGAGIGGQGVASALVDSAELIVVDRAEEIADKVASSVREAGGSATAYAVNLVDLDAVTAFRDEVLGRFGRVDAVVHLVGGWAGTDTVDADAIEKFTRLLPGIVTTVQTTTVAFRDALASAPMGRYLMVTSTSVAHPAAGNAAYAAAKSAAQTWVMALGDAFSGTGARAGVLAVSWLASPQMVADKPDTDYSSAVLTTHLGDVVAGLTRDADMAQGAYIDLTEETA